MRGYSDKVMRVLREMEASPEFPGTTLEPTLTFLFWWTLQNKPKRVLQLGTLMGYSALVIADALEFDGHLTTVDIDARKLELAEMYARKSGLDQVISIIHGDSLDPAVIAELREDGPYDLIYLDTSHYYDNTRAELAAYASYPGIMHGASLFVLHDTSVLAQDWDVTHKGGVRRALREFERNRDARLGLQVTWFDPPMYADTSGMALIYADRSQSQG